MGGCGHFRERNNDNFFIGPAETIANGNGQLWIVVFEQLGLCIFDVTSAEVKAEAGAMGGEAAEFFVGRHLGPSADTGEDNALDEFGDGEFDVEAGGRELKSADTRDDFKGDFRLGEGVYLLVDGSVEAGVA